MKKKKDCRNTPLRLKGSAQWSQNPRSNLAEVENSRNTKEAHCYGTAHCLDFSLKQTCTSNHKNTHPCTVPGYTATPCLTLRVYILCLSLRYHSARKSQFDTKTSEKATFIVMTNKIHCNMQTMKRSRTRRWWMKTEGTANSYIEKE